MIIKIVLNALAPMLGIVLDASIILMILQHQVAAVSPIHFLIKE